MKKEGYYWVFVTRTKQWEIAKHLGNDNWLLIGRSRIHNTNEFDEPQETWEHYEIEDFFI
jgi:hypothetical protein